MNFNEILYAAPMKYWAPPKTNPIIQTVLDNPLKYNQYKFTEKLDGEWNKLAWDGEHMYMLSRNKNVKGEYTDRWEKFPHILKEMKTLPKNTILLGEIAFDDVSKTSKDVGSIMRSLPARALKLQEKTPLHFYIFDCLMWDGEDLSSQSYKSRFMNNEKLSSFMRTEFTYVHLLKAKEMASLVEYLQEFFAKGGEGVVLIDEDQPYHFGKRPARSSIKIKKQLEEFEASVIAAIEPTKEYSGTEISTWQYWEELDVATGSTRLCGALHSREMGLRYTPVTKHYYHGWKNGIRCQYQGRVFDVASGLSDEDRAWLSSFEAEEAIRNGDLYAVISGMEFTEDSVRHPYVVRLRTDM